MTRVFLLSAVLLACVLHPVRAWGQQEIDVTKMYLGTAKCAFSTGAGSPEGAVLGKVCDTYYRTDTGQTYAKTSGAGTTTGWSLALFASAAGGTTGTLPKFSTSGSLANSLLSESGSLLSGAGTLGLTTTGTVPFLEMTQTGADSLNVRLRRTGPTPADWYAYIPTGSTEFRLSSSAGDAFALTAAGTGSFTSGVIAPTGTFNTSISSPLATLTGTTPLHLVQTGTGSLNLRMQRTAGTTADWYTYLPSGSTDLRFNDGTDRVSFLSGGGIVTAVTNSTAAIDLQQSGTGDLNMRLRRTGGTASDWFIYLPTGSTDLRFWSGGSGGADRLTMTAAGSLLPATNYVSDLGALTKKYLSIHGSELLVGTLVAANTQATIGGRVTVGPTTSLVAELSTAATTTQVKHTEMDSGDIVRLEADGQIEFLSVGSWTIQVANATTEQFEVNGDVTALFAAGRTFEVRPTTITNAGTWTISSSSYNTGIARTVITVTGNVTSSVAEGYIAYVAAAGAYTYVVGRNLDGSGANLWPAGAAVVNTGTTGDGFIDLYSTGGIITGTGPAIVGNVRTGTTYSQVEPRWAIGNLKNLFGYSTDTYGAAFGTPSAAWLKIDPTNGVRIGYAGATNIAMDASGNASFSGAITSTSGSIGGWTLGATTLTGGSATLASSGNLTLGTSNDVARLSADDATYRAWIGHATAASAPFRVSKAGLLTATSVSILAGGVTLDANGLLLSTPGGTPATASTVRFSRASASAATDIVGLYTTNTGDGPVLGNDVLYLTNRRIPNVTPANDRDARVRLEATGYTMAGAAMSSAVLNLDSTIAGVSASMVVGSTTTTFSTTGLTTSGTFAVTGASSFTGRATFGTGANSPLITGASGGTSLAMTSTGTGATTWEQYLTTGSAFVLYNGSNRLVLGSGGALQLPNYGAGTATFDASGNITSSSDARLKTVVGPFAPGLREVMGLQTVLYKYNALSGLDQENVYAGFLAQNVAQYVPEAVGEGLNGLYTVNVVPLMAATVNAIQQLTAEVDELRAFAKLPAMVRAAVPLADPSSRVISSAKAKPQPSRN